MGDFYASDMVLGGLFQQTIVMEMNEKDDKKKLESEVSAKGNILTAEAKSSISSSASVSVSIHNKRAKTKLRVLGGDTEIWLGLTEKNQASILKKWSDTIEPKNEVPVEMTLHPIWELLDGLDKKKMGELEKFVVAEWQKAEKLIKPRLRKKNPKTRYNRKGVLCMGEEDKETYKDLKERYEVQFKNSVATKGLAVGALATYGISGIGALASLKVEKDKWQEIVKIESKIQRLHRDYMLCAKGSKVGAKNDATCQDWIEEEWDNFNADKFAFPDTFETTWRGLRDKCTAEPSCKGFQWRTAPERKVKGGYLVSEIKDVLQSSVYDSKDIFECWAKEEE